MLKLVDRVQRWWRPRLRALPMPYEVACACGQVTRGQRQARYQVVRCSVCAGPVFVLGLSPLPPPASLAAVPALPAGHPAAGSSPRRANLRASFRLWRWPLLAAAVTLAGVVAIYVLVFDVLQRQVPLPSSQRALAAERAPAEAIQAHAQKGQKALAAGNFQLALDELAAGQGLLEQNPRGLTTSERRRYAQLTRQAALLADLLSESLGEVLQRASGLQEEEWQAQFERRYARHTVVFDAEVLRDGTGRYHLDYQVQAGAEPARIDVNDLQLLGALPRDRPARFLFGARLAGIHREAPGVWMVRFAPDSGVLLTDPGAVAAACPPPLEDLNPLLQRQTEWVETMP